MWRGVIPVGMLRVYLTVTGEVCVQESLSFFLQAFTRISNKP